ncbi:MAG: FHA domain-containing protein [bacterium]
MEPDPRTMPPADPVSPERAGSALLFQLRGDKAASAHLLGDGTYRIGSAKDNDLIVYDRSIRPHQVEVVVGEEGPVVRTLDPDGAVYLNGEPLTEAALSKGDILTLGQSVFRYVAPGECVSQEELWSAVGGRAAVPEKKGILLRRAGALLLALAVTAGLLGYYVFREHRPQTAAVTEVASLGGEAAFEPRMLRPLYEQGMDLLSARRWDQAIVIFTKIREQAPSFLDTEDAFREAVQESRNLDLLNEGKGLLLEGERAEAKRLLQSIDEESVYYRETERLVREIGSSSLEDRIRAAKEALGRGEWTQARKEGEAVLSKFPNHRDALLIVQAAQSRRKEIAGESAGNDQGGLQEQTARDEAKANGATGKAPSHTERSAAAAAPARPSSADAAAVREARPADGMLEAYLRGDVQTAQDRAHFVTGSSGAAPGDRESGMAAAIREAGERFRSALALQSQGNLPQALSTWADFLEKDRSVTGGGRGALFEQASASLGRIYYERGKREFDRGNNLSAFFFWHMAGAISPQDKDVRTGLAQLEDMAKQLYREGYSLQEINLPEALRRWKEVLKVVPPDHPYYRKAKKRIEHFAAIP